MQGAILGLDHVTLPVGDLELATRFYRDVLGGDLVELMDRAAWRKLFPHKAELPCRMERASFRFGPGPTLQLFVSAQRRAREDDHPHWAFSIGPGDVPAFLRRLREAGLRPVGPVRGGPLGQASIYVHDPSGNLIELTTIGYTGPYAD